MKKYLLLIAALAAYCSASALQLTFMLGNKAVTPGETITFDDITVTDYETYKEVKMKPELYLTTDLYSSKIKVSAKCTSGQVIQLCAGGTCRAGEEVVKENVTIQTNQKMDLGFDYIAEFDMDEAIPAVTTVFEAEDVTKADTKITFVLIMNSKGASVYELDTDSDIKGYEGGLEYIADKGCTLSVCTLSGVNVFSTEVSGTGFVSLPKGLYVYTFGSKTGKILIR